MKIEKTKFDGLYVITPVILKDNRGFFAEIYRKDRLKEAGIDINFVQDNQSQSKKNIIRGLHFQWDPPLGKLMRVIKGEVFMVVADIRKKSKTFSQWFGLKISEKNMKQVYAPFGFATGFCVLSDLADVQYKYTDFYNSQGEANILWNDPDLKIKWPVRKPILSDRDRNALTFNSWLKKPESSLF